VGEAAISELGNTATSWRARQTAKSADFELYRQRRSGSSDREEIWRGIISSSSEESKCFGGDRADGWREFKRRKP